jgi:hypothetical protein
LLAEGTPANKNPVITQNFSSTKRAGVLVLEKSEKTFSASVFAHAFH